MTVKSRLVVWISPWKERTKTLEEERERYMCVCVSTTHTRGGARERAHTERQKVDFVLPPFLRTKEGSRAEKPAKATVFVHVSSRREQARARGRRESLL